MFDTWTWTWTWTWRGRARFSKNAYIFSFALLPFRLLPFTAIYLLCNVQGIVECWWFWDSSDSQYFMLSTSFLMMQQSLSITYKNTWFDRGLGLQSTPHRQDRWGRWVLGARCKHTFTYAFPPFAFWFFSFLPQSFHSILIHSYPHIVSDFKSLRSLL